MTTTNQTPELPHLSDIIKAQSVLKGVVKKTPLEPSKSFSAMSGAKVFMKLENLQSTGSFKVRGAYNRISSLSSEELKNGVVCASAGNHAQGVAYAATKLKVKSTVFMPVFTPPLKVIATKAYGAEVILTGDNFDDALAAAMQHRQKSGAHFIHPFDDPFIIAGQGTIGLEIFDQLETVQDVLVPIGGGGLIAGIAIALKNLNPEIRIIGVEAEGSQSMKLSIENNQVTSLKSVHTIADGIAVKTPGHLNFKAVKELVDEIVIVNDAEIARTTYLLLQRAKILAEPAGVAAMAAVLYKKAKIEKRIVVPVICGGNINMGLLQQVLEKGMMDEGLRARIQVLIPDQAGELKSIVSILEKVRANIFDISHERSITSVPVGFVMVTITFNLQDINQLDTIKELLDSRHMKYKVLK
ncbi:MAG: threonine ammonia-lyase [Bacteroidales bacterium]|nr:threonine ammonia-lyase [Bacteroidales bacterium]